MKVFVYIWWYYHKICEVISLLMQQISIGHNDQMHSIHNPLTFEALTNSEVSYSTFDNPIIITLDQMV